MLQALENTVNHLPTIFHGEIHALPAAWENIKTTLTDVNMGVKSVDEKVVDQTNQVRQRDGLLRGLQSKVDQYAVEAQRVRKAVLDDLERRAKAQQDHIMRRF